MLPPETLAKAADLLAALRARGWRLATAESCTGGLIAAALTHVAGSSDVVDRGWVTYSDASKTELLGVDAALIRAHGAVSGEVAEAMARGALACSAANIAISVTGVAGPGGGSPDKPVGLVWFGCKSSNHCVVGPVCFRGDRADVRSQAVAHALHMVGFALDRATGSDV